MWKHRIRWCLHPNNRKIKLDNGHEWCGRCGAIWTGKRRKNGSKEWTIPQISIELNLSRHSA